MQIWSPPGDLGSASSSEATLALVRGNEPNLEYIDIYNNGYPSETQFGIRIQKRGTGVYRDFVFDQYDGTTKTPLMILKANGNVGIGTTTPTTGKLVISGGDLDMTGNRIINVSTPINGSDAATKAYVDAQAGSSGGGSCYVNYGNNTCASGWTKVVDGYTTIYAYGTYVGSLVCSSIDRSVFYNGSDNYTFRAITYDGYAMFIRNEHCAICCK